MFWSPVVTNRVVGVLRAWLTGTDPTNSPELTPTSDRVNVLTGCRAVTTPVLNGRESLFEAASTTTLPAPARFGSLTVTVSASLHSYRRSEEHTSELQSLTNLVCRLLLEKKKTTK